MVNLRASQSIPSSLGSAPSRFGFQSTCNGFAIIYTIAVSIVIIDISELLQFIILIRIIYFVTNIGNIKSRQCFFKCADTGKERTNSHIFKEIRHSTVKFIQNGTENVYHDRVSSLLVKL